ncbi:MAG: hypothetical protein II685_02875 [Clostridia bacterium]|nr:hypothetical protein [Clostridia bacterium]
MLENGEYEIDVSLAGGSGRASVTSPAKLFVSDGKMQAQIEWSSSNYDYMEVGGVDYYPINTDGNSTFVIDVSSLDTDIPVKAETLAMSTPHMIEYTLNFDSQSVRSTSGNGVVFVCSGCVLAAAVVFAVFMFKRKRALRKSNDEVL